MSKAIVWVTPLFFLFMGLEYLWGRRVGRNTYRFNDFINSMSLGILSQLVGVLTKVLALGVYVHVYQSWGVQAAADFWKSPPGWLLALLLYDLCYYWLHRLGHESAVLWAAHVVHHQSQQYNLSTALRQTSTGALLGWIFYLPLALLGVPPLVFAIVALADLLYQFWVHTEHVPKLGWFDRWFCSPSNHRVHHAINDQYLDKNYGGILIVWDRLFGTFIEEGERCVYGTRSPLRSWDPLWANAKVYTGLARDSWLAPRALDKLRLWLKGPGWLPAGVQQLHSDSASTERRALYNPPLAPSTMVFASLQFGFLLVGALVFLWSADGRAWAPSLIWLLAQAVGLWALGALLQNRINAGLMVLLDCAALSTAMAALGLHGWHMLLKPLTLLIAIIYVANYCYRARISRTYYQQYWLLAALCMGLVGDTALLFPQHFTLGLAAFLIGHLLYIACMRQDAPWFASRTAVAGVVAYAGLMVAWMWPSVPGPLHIPVALYIAALSCMAIQALGRAKALGDAASRYVALGAVLFLLSDSLLAVNKFVAPVAFGGLDAALWILSSYYAAQILLATFMLRSTRVGSSGEPSTT